MDTFDDGGYMGGSDDVVDNARPFDEEDMSYGYGGGVVDPPPLDGGFSGSPVHGNNDDMQPAYGFGGGSPGRDDYNASPFEDVAGGGYEEGKPYDLGSDSEGIFMSSDGGPVLPDPSQMREEGAAFREWRRQNAIYLEEKEKKEKEMRNQIIAEAEEYKRKFYEKRDQTSETNKAQNREREKLFLAHQEKFHKEADQQYWKAISELIPREVPNIEKRRGRKEEEKKPSVFVVQGPKPGKPTDMARMRQVLSKLKQNPPPHMIPTPPEKKDGKDNEKDGKKDAKDGKTDAKDGKTDAKDGKVSTPKASEDAKNVVTTPKASAAAAAAAGEPTPPAKGSANNATTPKTPKTDETSAPKGEESAKKEPSLIPDEL